MATETIRERRQPAQRTPKRWRNATGLAIEPTKDGPLHFIGSIEVVTGTGKTIDRTADCWLCRCGHSHNKPYCDGSHKAAGFRSGE